MKIFVFISGPGASEEWATNRFFSVFSLFSQIAYGIVHSHASLGVGNIGGMY